jgi:hypothetical protein
VNRTGKLSVNRGCTPVIDATYRAETDNSPAEAIITALADAAGVETVELPPLYDYVDFDALNSLFEGHQTTIDADIILSFNVETWNVFVRADGRIRVCDATQPTEPEPVFASSGP